MRLSEMQFQEPKSIEDAKDRSKFLLDEITEILTQLGQIKVDATGQPVPLPEFLRWKHRAKIALAIKQKERAYLKEWIKKNRYPVVSENDGLAAVYVMFDLVKDYINGKEQPGPDHWPIVEEVRSYLRQNGFTV